MIGVASRKAKRAASSLLSPASSPALMVAPEREKPGISPIACAVPTNPASRQLMRATRSSEPALAGEANTLRSGFSASSPMRPTGMVPTTSSQPRRAWTSSSRTSRSRSDRSRPLAISFQSLRKKKNRTSAVARCVATRKARKKSSF
jgi:hypothetical protein